MPLLEDVRTYLTTSGVISSGWHCYIGYVPDDDDQVVALAPTGGFPQDTLGGENMLPTFQIRIRGSRLDYVSVDAKWREVWKKLNNTSAIAGVFALIPMESGPLLFHDEKNRHNMTMNFRATIAAP